MRINQKIIYTATDFSMYKVRKGKLEPHGSVVLFLKNSYRLSGLTGQKGTGWFGTKSDFSTVPGSCPLTKIALLLNTVADKSTRIQWLPFLDIFFLSLRVLNLFLRSILNCKRCLESKSDTLLVTVYSKYLEQISVHVLTDIYHSRKQGKSVPLQDIQAGKKNKKRGLKVRGQRQEDTVPDTQLAVLRPVWVSLLWPPPPIRVI